MLYRPTVSALKTITCSLRAMTYTSIETSITSSDTTRYGVTLTSADLPAWNYQPAKCTYIGVFCLVVHNVSGGSVTVNWAMYKNNEQVNTGTVSSFTNNYYSVLHAHFYDVAIGDTIELSVWCTTSTSLTVQGSTYQILPSRIAPTLKPCTDVSYTYELQSAGNICSPFVHLTGNSGREFIGGVIYSILSSALSRSFSGFSFISQSDYYLFRYGEGDYGSSNTVGSTLQASTLQYRNSYLIQSITYREISQ